MYGEFQIVREYYKVLLKDSVEDYLADFCSVVFVVGLSLSNVISSIMTRFHQKKV